jgi:hypothetical protein
VSDDELRLTLRLNLRHEVRNDDRSVSEVEEKVVRMLNHPDKRVTGAEIGTKGTLGGNVENAESEVLDTRIAVGHRASGMFLELVPARWSHKDLKQLATATAHQVEMAQYADNVECTEWGVEPTKPGKRV